MKMSKARRSQASSSFDEHARFESDDESRISAFGFPKSNHGWIECISKSFPGQTYYFNVDTCCSTWNRPVSRFVPTRVARPLKLMSDEDFMDDPLIRVSDIEDENDYEEDDYDEEVNPDLPPDADDVKPHTITVKDTKESRDSKIYAQVLFKLYHSYSCDWNDNEIEDIKPLNCETLDDDSNENFASILPEACYSSDSDSKSTDSESRTDTAESETPETSEDHESLVEVRTEDKDQFGELDCLNVLRTNNSEIENEENPLDISASSVEESDVGSREIGLSSDDDEEEEDEEEEDEKTGNVCLISLPRLKTIEFADLARPRKIRKGKKAKKRKASNKNDETSKMNPPNKIIKIVCELNGVKTVNYDYLPPELPSGVKMSNLSDSGSSCCYDAWYEQKSKNASNNFPSESSAKATKTFGFLDEPMDFSEPGLSDSSSSSASSVGAKRTEKKILGVTKDLQREEIEPSDSSDSSSRSQSSCSDSDSSSASSVGAKKIETKKFLGITKKLKGKIIEPSKSFSSSSSSESSWRYSGSSNDDSD